MLGLYVHIPFCSHKCYYCDFVSYVRSENLMGDYVDCVLKELSYYDYVKFDTIFIGGGTPSYLDEKNLEKLLKGIKSLTISSNVLEFTIECNPGTLNYDKLRLMKEYGVNRLSLGLQSANKKTLKSIGRVHTLEDFDKNFNYAVNIGFDNINVDLIFGIPYENFEDYSKTLDVVVKNYNLTHISAYNLILEKNTRFYNMYKKNEFSELDEDSQLKSYNYTKKFLEKHDFYQYEISNYSKKNKECLHNLLYWNLENYLGIGVAAHSFFEGRRFENVRNLSDYMKMVMKSRHNYVNEHVNSSKDSIEEFVMLGFRKNEGISVIDFKNRFGEDFKQIFRKQLLKHEKNNLLISENDRIFLSDEGFCLMNFVLKDFVF